MSRLILPARFRQQPATIARVDRSNPLTTGLVELVLPPHLKSLSPRATAVEVTGSGVRVGPAPGGNAFSFDAVTDARLVVGTSVSMMPSTTDCTFFVLRQTQDTSNRNAALAGFSLSGTDRVLLHAPYVDGNLYFDFGNTTTGRVSVAFAKSTKIEALVFIAGGGKGREVWRDGVKIIGDTSVTAAWSGSSTPFQIGGIAGQIAGDLEWVYQFGAVKRAWSDAEVRAWTANPWSIFEPPSRKYWLPAATTTSSDGTGSTAQGQSADAAGTVASTGTASAAQGQTADVAGDVVTPGGFTFQGQTSDAAGTVASVGTTSTAQGQTADASGVVASTGTATAAQGQSASAAGELITLWTIVNSAIDLQDDPDGNNSANFAFTGNTLLPGLGTTTTGNAVVVLVAGSWRTDATPTVTVTDNAGNTYTAGTLFVNGSLSGTFVRQWAQAFYCSNATGNANLIPQFDVVQNASATVFDLPSRMHIAAFEVTTARGVELDVESFKSTTSSSTSITTDTFNTSGAGAVFAIELNFLEDTFAGSTVNFETDYTDLVRPKRLASTGDTSSVYGAAGYRITNGTLTGEQVTFTGDASITRNLLAVGFKSPAILRTGDAATAQAQGAQAIGGTGWSGPIDTAQAQSTAATGSVLDVGYVALTGVQASGAAGTAGPQHVYPVTGNALSGAVGSVRADRHGALGGATGTGGVGTVARGNTPLALTGAAAAGGTGSVTTSRVRDLTGVAASTQVATIAARSSHALTGASGTGELGFVTPPSGLAGVNLTGRAGSVRAQRTVALTGNGSSGQVGAVTTSHRAAATGVYTTGAVSSVVASRRVALAGVTATTGVGNLAAGQRLTGVAGSGAVGSVHTTRTIALSGVFSASGVGRVGNVRPTDIERAFVSTPPTEVTLRAETANVFIVSSAVSVVVSTPND
jgi:hypothetical protein